MSCDDVRDFLYLYVCDELTTSESRTVSEHLSNCPSCREALAEMIQLHTVMAARMPSIPLSYYSVNN
ncbi:MAG: zf-HC2 domain-containing protein [Chthonomonas sp.]|nr:zf-HC2 domain-containing protein [Chthonomonas sp.]